MSDVTFLELEGHIGIEPDYLHEKDNDGQHLPHPNAGEPGPLTSEAFSYAVPVMVTNPETGKAEVGSEVCSVQILPSEQPVHAGATIDPNRPDVAVDSRIIPGTRIIETTSPHVVSILTAANAGGYRLCDPPESGAKNRAKTSKSDAVDGSQEA